MLLGFSKLFFIYFNNCKFFYFNLLIFFSKKLNLILRKLNFKVSTELKLGYKYRFIFFKNILAFLKNKFYLNKFINNWRFKYLSFYKLEFKYNFSFYFILINKNKLVEDKNSAILNIYEFYDLLLYKKSSLNKIILTKRLHILNKLLLKKSYFSKKVYKLKKSFLKIKNINNKIKTFNFYFYKSLILRQEITNRSNIKKKNLIISFKIKKNNSFLILSDSCGQVIYFISAGRIAKGKKKRSSVTIKSLSRIFTKFIYKYLKHQFYKFKLLNSLKKLNIFIIFRINRLLNNYLIKTILFNFKILHLPIHFLIDSIKLPHSLGVKKKKLRRV